MNSDRKIFCIGLGKTGTTSLERALLDLGFHMGDQTIGEQLIDDWASRNFQPIIEFCRTAEAFQDVPFCLPYTFQALHQAYPDAKFILSIRSSAEEWYRSQTMFHSRLWADGQRIPTREDLARAFYLKKGYVEHAFRLIYDTPEDDPYNKSYMISYYEKHLSNVREYFRHRPDQLIEIQVDEASDYSRFCSFLGKTPRYDKFPWLNRTDQN